METIDEWIEFYKNEAAKLEDLSKEDSSISLIDRMKPYQMMENLLRIKFNKMLEECKKEI